MFKYYGIHFWNLLPNHLKHNTIISSLKDLIETWEVNVNF